MEIGVPRGSRDDLALRTIALGLECCDVYRFAALTARCEAGEAWEELEPAAWQEWYENVLVRLEGLTSLGFRVVRDHRLEHLERLAARNRAPDGQVDATA